MNVSQKIVLTFLSLLFSLNANSYSCKIQTPYVDSNLLAPSNLPNIGGPTLVNLSGETPVWVLIDVNGKVHVPYNANLLLEREQRIQSENGKLIVFMPQEGTEGMLTIRYNTISVEDFMLLSGTDLVFQGDRSNMLVWIKKDSVRIDCRK